MRGRGFFIAFEGIDGAGLTTQAILLERYLRERGFNVILTKEPTDGLLGGLIKAALRGEWKTDPATIQLLFAADRSHHVRHHILPALEEGKIVICDRYVLSSLAYGSVDLDYRWLYEINKVFPVPDITIILDLSPQIALSRIARSRFSYELFENSHKLNLVRKNYLKLAGEYGNSVIIDASKSIDDVHSEVVRHVERVIKGS
ncbi:MAG TPA: dTMP kinase [Thermoprotei archaeon]|nr:dTMP kinase [Thermoprotei archaeon]